MRKYFFNRKSLLGTAVVAVLLASGCGNSDNFVFTNGTIAPPVVVPAPPSAVDDAFSALGNATVTYSAANGVLTNDTVNGATISAFEATGSDGGTVVLNPDGSFSYTPVFGFVGAETFTYTLSNDDGDSTATVTMTSTGQGFFVNNQAGTTGDGSQADPFDALTDAINVAGNGDTIFVARGDGSSAGLDTDVTLPLGVSLIGEGTGLILTQTVVPQGTAPVIDATVTITGDNTISGLDFVGDNDAISGDGITGIVTITNNTFRGSSTSDTQIDLDNVLATVTISENTFNQDSLSSSVDFTTSGTCALTANSNVVQLAMGGSGNDGFRLQIDDGGDVTVQMNDNSFTGTSSDPLDTFCDISMVGASQASLTATGNNASFHYYFFYTTQQNSSQLTANFSGNVSVDNDGEPEYEFSLSQTSQATLVLDNNSMTNFRDDGVAVNTYDSSSLNLALRNNTIAPETPSASDPAVRVQAENSSNLCAEITGNTFGGDLRLSQMSSGNYDVEQFGDSSGDVLVTLNDFTTGVILVPNGAVDSVLDGACMIP